ncbi:hypothetical protein ACQCWA_22500 [Rossellomorea aquimaris]|uniref:hypothetical protein n=1 Tax=Rossellomorea aquimaris TaxID=189382 RepID=UPI003CF45E2F
MKKYLIFVTALVCVFSTIALGLGGNSASASVATTGDQVLYKSLIDSGYSPDEAMFEIEMMNAVTKFYSLDSEGNLSFDFKKASKSGVKGEYLDRVKADLAKIKEIDESKQKSKSFSDGPDRGDTGPGGGGDGCAGGNYHSPINQNGTISGTFGLDHCNTNTLIDYLAYGVGAATLAAWISRKTAFPVGTVLSAVTGWVLNTYRVEIARADVGRGVYFYYRYPVSGYVIPYGQ